MSESEERVSEREKERNLEEKEKEKPGASSAHEFTPLLPLRSSCSFSFSMTFSAS